jgi:hypothetical protein
MFTKHCHKLELISVLVSMLAFAADPFVSMAQDFTINDQYDHGVQLSSLRGKPVLLIYGDRLGSDYMGTWAAAVRKSAVSDSVNVVRIANLRAVPGLMHSYVKRQFAKPDPQGKPNSPVLLDWNEDLGKIYGFTEDLTNVYLIDEKGILRYTAFGKGTTEETGRLIDKIATLGRTQ